MLNWLLTLPGSNNGPDRGDTHDAQVSRGSADRFVTLPITGNTSIRSTIALSPAGKKSFAPGMVYQFIYPATNPKVIGIGFAAVRDFVSAPVGAAAQQPGRARNAESARGHDPMGA